MKNLSLGLLASAAMAITACAPSKQQLQKVLEDNPEILTSVIEKHPLKFMTSLNKAAQDARGKQGEEQEAQRQKELDEEFKNPKKPEINEERAMVGSKDAPIVLVEYSDFQCPYCSRGYQTVMEVKKKYGDKIRFHFKHLPLDFHPLAMPAAEWFEAIALQSPEKAYKFHDKIFENQDKLNSGKEKFLESAAKEAGADVAKAKKDLKSEKVQARIKADMEEARKFEFSGTPGFLINGISLKGAYPTPEFEKIIDRMLAGK